MDRSPTNIRVLVIDDDDGVRSFVTRSLTRVGFIASSADGGVQGIAALDSQTYDVVICDLAMPDKDGLEVLKHAAKLKPRPAFIMLTGVGSITVAVEAMKRGAAEFLEKPAGIDTLRASILSVMERAKEESAPAKREKILTKGLVGSPSWIDGFTKQLVRIAGRDSTTLILGETGTGKSAVAREIWRQSNRAKGPFVEMNCAAIPESLMESELFGHKKGAFTGATADYAGRVEQANGGTLFLDEIGELKLELQSKLLQLLQEKTYTPVGGTKQQTADVRFIAATNKDLEAEAATGRFRSDLYYRLNVVDLVIPPLRDRLEDVPLLIAHFQRVSAEREPNEEQPIFAPETVAMMQRYKWPGNVRELENFVERMSVKKPGETIEPIDLPPRMQDGPIPPERNFTMPEIRVVNPADTPKPAPPATTGTLGEVVQGYEKDLILRALERNAGNRSKTARDLGMPRTTLIERIKRFGIGAPKESKHPDETTDVDVDDPSSEE